MIKERGIDNNQSCLWQHGLFFMYLSLILFYFCMCLTFYKINSFLILFKKLSRGGQKKKTLSNDCQYLRVLSRSVVSNSLRLHRLQPVRLLCPWDSPGKNTRVGCQALLQGIFPTQAARITGGFFYRLSHEVSPCTYWLRG